MAFVPESELVFAAEHRACRMCCDQALELADELLVPVAVQVSLDSILQRLQSELFEVGDVRAGEGLGREVCERPASSETSSEPRIRYSSMPSGWLGRLTRR